MLALLVALPLVPLVRPIKARIAGHVVATGTTTTVSNPGSKLPRQGLSTYSFAASGRFEDPEHVAYVAKGPIHVSALRVQDWVYYLVWFRGSRQ